MDTSTTFRSSPEQGRDLALSATNSSRKPEQQDTISYLPNQQPQQSQSLPPQEEDDEEGDDESSSASNNNALVQAAAKKLFELSNLPAEFVQFLSQNEINPAIYTVADLPRYVRLNPDPFMTITADELSKQLGGVKVEQVNGLPGFCKILDGETKLRNTQAYKDGRIFGMDLSSGIAVHALDIQPGDHVLDICCAPGAKLCMIAGLLTNSGGVQSNRTLKNNNQFDLQITGTVTGVDISAHRLATCRSLLKRHRLQQHARLFQADGTTFGVLRPSAIDTVRAKILARDQKRQQIWNMKNEGDATDGAQVKRGLEEKEDEENESPKEVGGGKTESMQIDGASIAGTGTISSSQPLSKRQKAPEAVSSSASSANPKALYSYFCFNDTHHYGPESQTGCKYQDTPIQPTESQTPFFAPKILRNDPQLFKDNYKYDKVIVDAECTHDGSIAHILKYETWGWDNFHKNFMSRDRLDSLFELQFGLLMNGFRLVKAGGILVYSTCSLSRAQNEDVVATLLGRFKGRVVLESISNQDEALLSSVNLTPTVVGIPLAPCKKPSRVASIRALGFGPECGPGMNDEELLKDWIGTEDEEGEIRGMEMYVTGTCMRFDPLISRTSGFFLAKFRKLA